MKTDIQTFKAADLLADIRKAAPSVCVEVMWEPDPDARWDCGEHLDRDDYRAWQSGVRATAILDGRMVTGSAYLSGTWIEWDKHPATSNPEISGYLPQMLEEALRELGKLIAADHAQPKAVACGRLLGGGGRFTKSTNKNKKHNALK